MFIQRPPPKAHGDHQCRVMLTARSSVFLRAEASISARRLVAPHSSTDLPAAQRMFPTVAGLGQGAKSTVQALMSAARGRLSGDRAGWNADAHPDTGSCGCGV